MVTAFTQTSTMRMCLLVQHTKPCMQAKLPSPKGCHACSLANMTKSKLSQRKQPHCRSVWWRVSGCAVLQRNWIVSVHTYEYVYIMNERQSGTGLGPSSHSAERATEQPGSVIPLSASLQLQKRCLCFSGVAAKLCKMRRPQRHTKLVVVDVMILQHQTRFVVINRHCLTVCKGALRVIKYCMETTDMPRYFTCCTKQNDEKQFTT